MKVGNVIGNAECLGDIRALALFSFFLFLLIPGVRSVGAMR